MAMFNKAIGQIGSRMATPNQGGPMGNIMSKISGGMQQSPFGRTGMGDMSSAEPVAGERANFGDALSRFGSGGMFNPMPMGGGMPIPNVKPPMQAAQPMQAMTQQPNVAEVGQPPPMINSMIGQSGIQDLIMRLLGGGGINTPTAPTPLNDQRPELSMSPETIYGAMKRGLSGGAGNLGGRFGGRF